MGYVTFVGGGCGRGLITLNGLTAIRSADVILYDNLIDSNLLEEAKPEAELLYVGKRSGQHSRSQEEINRLLVEKAKEDGHVVRLKGGDSFVFGRGGEEVLALQREQLAYELIPGVSSAIAVPEHVGIPVTHRMDARSFTVVTGHTANGEGENFEALAKLSGTLVFLMGLGNAAYIASELMRYGKPGDTPAAIISDGFGRNERLYHCTLETLGETAKQAETPAVLVIGKTAAFRMAGETLRQRTEIRVTVTGTEHMILRMKQAMAGTNSLVTGCRCLAIQPLPEAIPSELSGYEWLVFTSANGIRIFFEEMRRRGTDLRCLLKLKFAVIGQGTADSLWQYGIHADLIPSEFISDVFGRELGSHLKHIGSRAPVLILRAEEGAPSLTRELERAGISYEDVSVYRTEEQPEGSNPDDADYVVFSSAAGVRAYFRSSRLPDGAVPVVIGPSTGAELVKHTTLPYLMPEEHTAEGMASLILSAADCS